MSTAPPPSTRPSRPTQARPAPGGSPTSQVTIDPVKLFKKYFFVLALAGVVGVAVGFGADTIWRTFFPTYEASTTFEVDPPRRSIATANTGEVRKDELERYIATQAQAILSTLVLQNAVEKPALVTGAPNWVKPFLDSNGRLKTADAVIELQKELVARPLPNTNYMRLRFRYNKANDVYEVVKTVTQAYQDFLRDSNRKDQQPIRDQLAQQLRELQDAVESDQNRIDRLLLENQIESVDSKLTEAGEQLDLAVGDRARVQEQISIIETQTAEYMRELNDPTGPQIPEDIRDRVRQLPLIQQLESQLQAVKARQRSEERLGIGPEHPSMKALQSQIDGLQEEISAQTDELHEQAFNAAINGLRVSLAQSRALEAELTDRIEVAQDRLTEIARIGQEVNKLDRTIAQTQDRISTTEEELDQVVGLLSIAEQGRVSVAQPAFIPEQVTFPPNQLIVIAGGTLVVLGLTVGLIVLREVLDQRVKGPADIAMIPRTPVLGMLPDVSEDPSRPERAESAFHDRPAGVFAESVRQLRVALATKVQQAGHRSVLVVPAAPRSGGTTTVTNLAEAVSRADTKVLILDANLRRPSIHKLFNLDASPGLADVLAKSTEVEAALCKTDNPNLDVMTVGSPENRVFERLSTESMSELLARLEARYDLVLVDVAPAQVAGDAAGLANRVGGVVLVTRALAEKRGLIARLKNELSGTQAEFLGVVVNGVRSAAGGYFKRNMREAHAYQHKAKAADA